MVPAAAPPTRSQSDRSFFIFNAALSAAALLFLAWLLIFRRVDGGLGWDLRFLPTVNAVLNSLSTVLLISGWVAIRRQHRALHKYLMVGAFAASVLFLIGYVAYHYAHGDTKFTATGTVRTVYLAILASHVLLSMSVPPLALTILYFAYRGTFARHRKVARIALPIWLYVSATGVLIYFMLHVWFRAAV